LSLGTYVGFCPRCGGTLTPPPGIGGFVVGRLCHCSPVVVPPAPDPTAAAARIAALEAEVARLRARAESAESILARLRALADRADHEADLYSQAGYVEDARRCRERARCIRSALAEAMQVEGGSRG
jgi:hypothetical protein